MAVQNCTKQVHLDSEEEDDGPTIFKRSTPSKQNQLSSFRKLPSQNNAGSATKHTSSSLHASKDKTLGLQKDKTSSSKISIERPKTVSSNASASVHDNDKGFTSQSLASSLKMKASPSSKSSVATENSINSDVKKPLSVRLGATSTGSNSTVDQKPPKQILAMNNSSGHMSADRPSGKAASPDDSDDDANVPLSAKFSSASLASQRGNSFVNSRPGALSTGNKSAAHQNALKQSTASGLTNNSCGQITADKLNEQARSPDDSDSVDDDNVPLSTKFSSASLAFHRGNSLPTMNVSIKEASDDSEDEKPLLYRLQAKIVGAPSVKSDPDKNPSSSKIMANGYAKKESIDGLHPKGSSKRSIDDTCNSGETSIKKAKVLGNTAPVKLKQEVVVKKEQEIDDDHIPIAQRMKKPVSSVNQVSMKKEIKKSVSAVNQVSMKKEIKKTTLFKKDGKKMKTSRDSIYSKSSKVPPGSGGGAKWTTLVHNGVIFPPQYTPHGIKMLYNGQPVDLTPEQEEVATMFAVMKETDYATKLKFIENFMNDWRSILGKNHVIKKFDLCDFTPIYEWHLREKEKKKQLTSEEKKKIKEDKMKQEDKYMWAIVDGVKEKVGNFRVEPPGLFRGRGEHPKMGKLKRRIRPRDITINIGKGAPIPECPIPGERWKEVKHDNTVTWLAYWSDPINSKEYKYVFLAASSSLKGQSDKEKYEKARMLKNSIQNIRANYTKDFNSKDATKRQIAVATYLIDKLALRAGNEKDDDEADTVGCCTLKMENVKLLPPNKLQFDFLGKDSIRYFNTVEVELAVYKAIGEFQSARKNDGRKKTEGDDLFDLLDTSKLNAHLKELMPGLTAKVFRTYNASITLDVMLHKETKGGTVLEKVAVYQMANKEAAIICNHQRSVSKSHDAQISKLDEKINELKAQKKELEVDLSKAKRGKPLGKDSDGKLKKNLSPELLEKKMAQFDLKIEKMESSRNLKEDMKTVALGTSKINYLDPRITVAWCKRNEVPIEKVFNKSLLAKFAWAMDVDPDFRF